MPSITDPLDPASGLSLNNLHAHETSLLDQVALISLLGIPFYVRGITQGKTK